MNSLLLRILRLPGYLCLPAAVLITVLQSAFTISFADAPQTGLQDSDVAPLNGRATLNLANTYIQQKRPREAEALLLKLIADLEKTPQRDPRIEVCLFTLSRAYVADKQPLLAKECLEHSVRFTRENDPRRYLHVLVMYELFLLRQKMYEDAAKAADELFVEASKPIPGRNSSQSLWQAEHIPCGMIAHDFADVNEDESTKYYKVAFDLLTHAPNPPTNSEYATTALNWAGMLEKHGKLNEAIDVLKQAIVYSQTLKPEIAYSDWMKLEDTCQEYLREAKRGHEADILEAARMETLSNPNTPPLVRIRGLTDTSYKALDNGKCDQGLDLLHQALGMYLAESSDRQAEQYGCFRDIRSRLTKCGHAEEGTEILWRLVKVHMKSGFPDPEDVHRRRWDFGPIPKTADEELLGGVVTGESKTAQEKVLQQFLAAAKDSGNQSSVVFAQYHLKRFQSQR